jgi:hypothetical protein
MSKLPKFTLSYNEKKEDWDLRNDKTDRLLKSFDTKEDATKGGVLEKTLGTNGGSVKIQKADGKIQEERTFPGSKDPESSKG